MWFWPLDLFLGFLFLYGFFFFYLAAMNLDWYGDFLAYKRLLFFLCHLFFFAFLFSLFFVFFSIIFWLMIFSFFLVWWILYLMDFGLLIDFSSWIGDSSYNYNFYDLSFDFWGLFIFLDFEIFDDDIYDLIKWLDIIWIYIFHDGWILIFSYDYFMNIDGILIFLIDFFWFMMIDINFDLIFLWF